MTVDDIPSVRRSVIPSVTRDQMREVDRLMVDEFGILLIQMMENAGLQLARLTGRIAAGGPIIVIVGGGNNGGGGLAAARRLHSWGFGVSVVTIKPLSSFTGLPAAQLRPLLRFGVPVCPFSGCIPKGSVIVDALIGYGLEGAVRGESSEIIKGMNQAGTPVVSLDVPSGLDADTGLPQGVAVRADGTVTLALPKRGLLADGARQYVGQLYVADIAVPGEVLRLAGVHSPDIFREHGLIRLES